VLTFSELDDLSRGAAITDVACPSCGPGRKAASNRVRKVMRIWNSDDDFLSYNCSRCGAKGYAHPDNASRAARPLRPVTPPRPTGPTEEQIRKLNDAREIWREAVPAGGTLAEVYLKSRCCWSDNAAVRFVSSSQTLTKYYWNGPAMVTAFGIPEEPEPGKLVLAPENTKLHADGTGKADVDRDKIMLASSSGWPIVLTPVNDIGGLLIAEGIETTLASHIGTGLGAWTCRIRGATAETRGQSAGLRRDHHHYCRHRR
jgi:hypothetical protein